MSCARPSPPAWSEPTNVSVEDNEPSRRNIEKAGYRPVARITRVTRFGRRRVRTQPLA